jgi:hypothetical protein
LTFTFREKVSKRSVEGVKRAENKFASLICLCYVHNRTSGTEGTGKNNFIQIQRLWSLLYVNGLPAKELLILLAKK